MTIDAIGFTASLAPVEEKPSPFAPPPRPDADPAPPGSNPHEPNGEAVLRFQTALAGGIAAERRDALAAISAEAARDIAFNGLRAMAGLDAPSLTILGERETATPRASSPAPAAQPGAPRSGAAAEPPVPPAATSPAPAAQPGGPRSGAAAEPPAPPVATAPFPTAQPGGPRSGAAVERMKARVAAPSDTKLDDPASPDAAVVAPPPQALPTVQPAAIQATAEAPAAARPAAADATAAAAHTRELAAAAEAVADRILVSPDLAGGEGEIRISLRKEVLGGSGISLTVSGQTLTVAIEPATADAAQLVERNLAQLQTTLGERVHAYKVTVVMKKGRSNETD